MKTHCLLTSFLLIAAAHAQMPGMPATRVQVEKTITGKDKVSRRSIGHIEAIQTVHVSAAVEGFLQEVNFQEGSLVQKGDVLFRINPVRYQAAVQQAQAALEQLDAKMTYAANRYQRLVALEQKQAASREDMESAFAEMEEIKAQRAGAEADLTRAQKDLDDCTIRAEISGRIGRVLLSQGNYVTQGERLVTIKQLNPIYVRFPLSQADVNGIFGGAEKIAEVADVRLVTADGRKYPSKGKIDIVDNQLSDNTDSYTLWARFDNENDTLTPRGIGALSVALSDTACVTMAPMTAVRHDERGAFVYVVDDSNRISRRDVVVGSVQGRFQSVYSGLKPGEVVVTDGAHKTRAGATVEPVYPADEEKAGRAMASDKKEASLPAVVSVEDVTLSEDPTEIVCQGARVEAVNLVELRPLVQGLLVEQNFKEGDAVKKGEVLFRIDPTRYQAAVDSQKAKIEQLSVSINDAKSKYDRQLFLQQHKAGSKDEMENAKARYEELLAEKRGAEAALAVAEDDLTRCTVRAAMDAKIGRVSVSRGNYIADKKSPLASIVQISPVYVRFPMSEASILATFGNDQNLLKEANVTLRTASGETYEESGRIAFCDNVVQPETDTQNIWARFDNKDGKLQPGGVVTIKVSRTPGTRLPAVPSEAVQTDTRGRYVFVAEEGRAVYTPVLCGASTGDGRTIIYSGLECGQQVVASDMANLEDGDAIQAK